MIQNDEEKEWMLPLLTLRNELDVTDDRHLRDFRRMAGHITIFHDAPVHGPYTQQSREYWLRRILEAQQWIRANGPRHMADFELITHAELVEIRRIWMLEKHELEDSLPRIFHEVTGESFNDDSGLQSVARRDDIEVLKEICGEDSLHFEMTRSLIAIERQFRSMARRAGLFDELEKAIRKSFYEDVDDALDRARALAAAKSAKVADWDSEVAASKTHGESEDDSEAVK